MLKLQQKKLDNLMYSVDCHIFELLKFIFSYIKPESMLQTFQLLYIYFKTILSSTNANKLFYWI